MAGKYTTPPNVIKLTLDFHTLDRLKALAATRKQDVTRCAYELLQECLGIQAPPQIEAPRPAEQGRQIDLSSFDAFNTKPKGNA